MPHAPAGRLIAWQIQTLYNIGTASRWSDAALLGRFLIRNDAEAFSLLVERHGPMVLRVCREIAPDASAADDSFQATFLVLLRSARRIERRGSLGAWLHGVARRVSLKARTRVRVRQTRLEQFLHSSGWVEASQRDDPARVENLALHEEIERLPAKYREPIVLCYLEGLTHEQAAQRLGWPLGTVRGRLARARDRLRSRLTRDAEAVMLLPASVGASVPEGLRRAIRDLVSAFTANSANTSAIASPIVTNLASASGGVSPMFGGKVALFAANATLAGAVLVAAGWTAQEAAHQAPPRTSHSVVPGAPGPARTEPPPSQAPSISNTAFAIAALAKAQDGAMTNVVYTVADLVPDEVQGEAFIQAVDPLIQLLTSTVAPGTWAGHAQDGSGVASTDEDGKRGTITAFLLNKSVIVRHEPAVQAAVAERLRQLRRLTKLGATSDSPPARPVGELMTATYKIPGTSLIESEKGPRARDSGPILSLITSTVAQGTWKGFDTQGRQVAPDRIDQEGYRVHTDPSDHVHVGSITVSADRQYIRVTHTPAVHAQLAAFLDRLQRLGGGEPVNGAARRQGEGVVSDARGALPPREAAAPTVPAPPQQLGDDDRNVLLHSDIDRKPIPREAGDSAAPGALPPAVAPVDPWDYSEYRFDHPDSIRITVLDDNWQGKSRELVVSPEGTINLGVEGGELTVRGITLDEIKVNVIEALRKKGASDVDLGLVCLRDGQLVEVDPEKSERVKVEVAAFNSHTYTVEGSVKNPGSYPWIKGTSLLVALTRAGGVEGDAESLRVQIIRAKPEPNRARVRDIPLVTLSEWLVNGQADAVPILNQDDRVVVMARSGSVSPVQGAPRAAGPTSDSERLNAQQKRIDALEEKLDRMLELLEKPGGPSTRGSGDTSSGKPGAVERRGASY
jgi:RNA polymerase sigma factor (sigma-70 family)